MSGVGGRGRGDRVIPQVEQAIPAAGRQQRPSGEKRTLKRVVASELTTSGADGDGTNPVAPWVNSRTVPT